MSCGRPARAGGNVRTLAEPDFGVRTHFPRLFNAAGFDEVPTLAQAAAQAAGVRMPAKLRRSTDCVGSTITGRRAGLAPVRYSTRSCRKAWSPDSSGTRLSSWERNSPWLYWRRKDEFAAVPLGPGVRAGRGDSRDRLRELASRRLADPSARVG